MDIPANPTDEQLDQLNQKQEFVRDALPAEWLSYAEELHDAAEALWAARGESMCLKMRTLLGGAVRVERKTGHERSYILLASLALENALKALLVSADPSLINSGALARCLRNHKLMGLADRVSGLRLSSEENRVLHICQDAIPYWGRYPVPLTYDGVHPEEAATSGFRDAFRRLHFRLCQRVYSEIKHGWDSGVGPKTLEFRSLRYGDKIDTKKPFPWLQRDAGCHGS